MFNLPELETNRARKALAAKEIFDNAEKADGGARPLADDELSIIDTLKEDITKLDAQIAQIQAHNRRREEVDGIMERLEKPQGPQVTPDLPAKSKSKAALDNGGWFKIPAQARRTGSLKAFKGERADEKAYKSGMWCLATLFGNEKAKQWYGQNFGYDTIQNAMSTFSNPDGGFLVPDEFAQTIIDLREEYGVFRRYARVWPMSSDTLTIPRRTGGLTWGALGEASTITDSNPTGDNVMLVAKKSGGLVKLSSEISEDSAISIADWLAREFAWAAAKFEDDCGFIGDGTSTYNGIRGLEALLIESSSLTGAQLAASGHDTLLEIDAPDIALAMGRLPAFARPNAKFFCSQMVAEYVFGRLQAAGGGNTIGDLSNGKTGRSYLGYEIVVSQTLEDSTGTINSTPIFFFGDLSKSSALGDRRQLRVMASEHAYLATDQLGVRATSRFDIINHDIGTTSVAGPIVALLGNT